MKNLPRDQWSEDEERFVHSVVSEFSEQFYIEGDPLSKIEGVKHHIHLKPNAPIINIRQFKLSDQEMAKMKEKIDIMLEQGIIEESMSPFNQPSFLVKKKEGTGTVVGHRLVTDFKKLNEFTESIGFPIPLIDTIIKSMGGCKYFSILDVNSAFHQVELHEEDRHLTAFSIGYMKYQYRRLPMGLSNAPITYQNVVVQIFKNLLGNGVNIYMDDIGIATESREKHDQLIREVLTRAKKSGLQFKMEKCRFFAKSVKYLGYVVSAEGVKANPSKVQCINEYPQPKTVLQVQRFLGMINYFRRFIKDHAKLARPLTQLCSPSKTFLWSEACQGAFSNLKRALIEEVTLEIPDRNKTLYLTCDASADCIGCVLSCGDPPEDRPVHFFSKTLNKSQQNYSTIDRELYAIVMGTRVFREYLYLRPFVIITDHRPLVHLFNVKNTNSRLFRYRWELSDLDFKILYRPGKTNYVADALSRIPMQLKTVEEVVTEHGEKDSIRNCRMITRSKARVVPQVEPNSNRRLHVNSTNGVITKLEDFDHVFSILTTPLDTKLLEKIAGKKQINIPDNKFNNFTDGMSIAMVSERANITTQLDKLVNEMVEKIENNSYNNIAININFKNSKNLFAWKMMIRNKLANVQLDITLCLNRVVEITDVHEINDILKEHHNTKLGGHCGIQRMLQTLKKIYSWPTINLDVKKFVNECEICEKTKFGINTKVPLQITSTSECPFDHVFIDFVGPITPESADGMKYIFTVTCDLTKYVVLVPTRDMTAVTTAECFIEKIILVHGTPSQVTSDNGTNFTSGTFRELNKKLKSDQITTTPYHPRSNIIERVHRTMNAYLRAFTQQNPQNWNKMLPTAAFSLNNTVHSTTGFTPHHLLYGHEMRLPEMLLRKKPIYNYENYVDIMQSEMHDAWSLAREKLNDRKIANKNQYDKKLNPVSFSIGDLVLLKKDTKKNKFEEVWSGPFIVEEVPSEAYLVVSKDGKRKKTHCDKVKKYKSQAPSADDQITVNFVRQFLGGKN